MNILIGQHAEEALSRSFKHWSDYGRHTLVDSGGVFQDQDIFVAYIVDENGVVNINEVSSLHDGVRWIKGYNVNNKL